MAKTTRRQFIVRTALGFGGYLAISSGACKAPRDDRTSPAGAPPPALPKDGLRSLSLDQYRLVTAACERILPRDEDPGATDLGCATYIDRMMAEPEARQLWGPAFFGGLTAIERQAKARYTKPFADAAVEEQEELLSAWQQSRHSGETAFFEVLHSLTLEGAFGDPTYGGNKDGRGFVLTGFVPPEPMPGMHLVHLHEKRPE